MQEILLPKRLTPGMKVGLIAPSSPIYEEENKILAKELLVSIGFSVIQGESCNAQRGYLAGDDALRANDINKMFEDDSIDGIICLRGGSGAARLLSLIDYSLIRRKPKVLVGFSDITVLHCALQEKCGLVTFHGPMAGHPRNTGFREESSRESFFRAVSSIAPMGRLQNPDKTPFVPWHGNPKHQTARGRLTGGNLGVLCSLLGTPYLPDLNNKIILLEANGEKPFHIDAQLCQLKNAGVFSACAGIILGDFTGCIEKTERPTIPIEELFEDFLPRDVPVLSNVHAGHGWDKITLPMNILYEINGGELRALEPAVI